MNAECFLDTNVLVYAAAAAGGDENEDKRACAIELIESVDFGLSAQVLQEFYVTVTKKIDVPMSAKDALAWIEELQVFPCVSIGPSIVKIAIETSERYGISYWDAAIVASAQELGSKILYTEDLNHGQRYAGIDAVNPFR